MFEGIRKRSSTLVTRGLLVFLGLVFAFFFGTSIGGFSHVKPAATINCRQIGPFMLPGCQQILAEDVDRGVTNIRNTINNVYGDSAPQMLARMNLRETAVEQLIDQKLVENEARRINLSISDNALEQTIESQSAFQVNGRFDVTRYQQLLAANELQPAAFEAETRGQILQDTMRSMVTHATFVSTAEARAGFNQFEKQLALSYVEIPYSQFTAGLNPSDAEVAKFYQQNKEIFREPDRIKVTYIKYDPSTLAAAGEPSEQDIEDFYDDNAKTMFTHPAEVDASHILIAVPGGATQQQRDAAHAEADDLLKQLQAGGNFAALAKKYSDDPGTKNNGGDLGFFSRGEMVKPFEEAAFSLKPGQMTIVQSQYGYHIIKVDEVEPAGTDAPEKVRSRIIAELKRKAGVEMGKADVQQDLTAALAGHSFDDIAKSRGLTVVTTPLFAENEPVKGAEDDSKLGPELFKFDDGSTQAVTDTDVPYLIKIVDKSPSHIPQLAEIHDLVREMLIRVTAENKARQVAESMLAKIKAPADFLKVAADNHLDVRPTGSFARSSEAIPDLGSMPTVVNQAAAIASVPGVLRDPAENDGNWYIFELTGRIAPDKAQWEADGPDFSKKLLDGTQAQAWVNFVNDLKSRAEIRVDPNQLAATGSS
jgi:peptidyl-prolyl cis-trans isomerase D